MLLPKNLNIRSTANNKIAKIKWNTIIGKQLCKNEAVLPYLINLYLVD